MVMKKQLADTRVALEEKGKETERNKAAIQLLEIELNTARKLHAISEDNIKLEVAALEDQNRKLALRLEGECRSKDKWEEKASKYDQLQSDFEALKLENSKHELQLQQLNDILETLRLSESASRRSAEEYFSAKSMLERDKTFLDGELRKVQVELDDRSRSLEQAKMHIASLEVKVRRICVIQSCHT